MNDLLQALRVEKRLMDDRIYIMKLYIEKQLEVISNVPYNQDDVIAATHRLNEVNLCIAAILQYRQKEKISSK